MISYTPELVSELKTLVEGKTRPDGVKAVGKRLKVAERTARTVYAKYFGEVVPQVLVPLYKQPPGIKTSEKDGNLDTEVKTYKVSQIEDVVKLCNVDQSKWETRGFSVAQNGKGEFVWRASFKQNQQAMSDDLLARVTETLGGIKSDWSKVKTAQTGGKGLYMLGLPDLHIGKLSDDETWGSYDSKKAKELAQQAVQSLMKRIDPKQIDRICLPVGNDLIHVDRPDGTTSNNTRQDCDTRSHKMFTTAVSLISEIVQGLAETFQVDVVMVRGNHDSETVFHLGEVFKAYFRGHKNVTIDNGPAQRKYYRYYKNLFLYTHGNNEKHADLPLIMAQERKQEWGETLHRFVMLGHFHHESVKDHKGVRVHILPSLSGIDGWHSDHGFVGSNRAALGMFFDGEEGLMAQYYFYATV